MYIAIAGNIGSGKTTLTEILTKRYGAKAYYENLSNPYISDFYEDMGRWSFHLQLWFLGSRIQQTLEMLADGSENIVQDRTIYEDAHIFANNLHAMGLMASRDFDTYMKMFNIEQDLLPKPDVLIYPLAGVIELLCDIHRLICIMVVYMIYIRHHFIAQSTPHRSMQSRKSSQSCGLTEYITLPFLSFSIPTCSNS